MEEGELPDEPVSNPSSPPTDASSEDEGWTFKSTLPVAPMNESFDPTAEPETGEEYLRLVRHYDSQLPFAIAAPTSVVVDVEEADGYCSRELSLTSEVENVIKTTPLDRLPDADWIARFVESFDVPTAAASNRLEDVEVEWPAFGHAEAWKALLYPSSEAAPTAKRPCLTTDSSESSMNPDVLLLVSPSQRQLMQLLRFHQQRWVDQEKGFTPEQYHCIMRILQALDRRVTGNQAANLRQLGLFCLRLRRDLPHPEKSQLIYLNGTITAIARFFGQTDLLGTLDES